MKDLEICPECGGHTAYVKHMKDCDNLERKWLKSKALTHACSACVAKGRKEMLRAELDHWADSDDGWH